MEETKRTEPFSPGATLWGGLMLNPSERRCGIPVE